MRHRIERLLPGFYPLHSGFTTGSCACAAAKAALSTLLTGEVLNQVTITLPDGEEVELPVSRTEKDVYKRQIGDFTEADLSVYPVPDAVFIGGHGGKLARILTILAGIMPVGGIVVFNSVSEESLNLFRQEAVRSGFRLTDECRIAVDDHNPIDVYKRQPLNTCPDT